MFRIFGVVMTVITLPVLMPGAAIASYEPGPANCVWYDQVVCSYQVIDGADLAAGQQVSARPLAGLPAPERVEIRRTDAEHLMIYFFYPSRRDLQGVAQ
jgi:hypothetical protein